MTHKLVAFSDSIEKWANFIINFGFIKGGIGGPTHILVTSNNDKHMRGIGVYISYAGARFLKQQS